MIQGALGIIDKMRIEVYSTQDFSNAEPIKTIFVQVNPDKYTIDQKVEFHDGQAVGSSSQNLRFNRIGSEEVSFEFLFDSSGIIPPAKIIEGKADNLPLAESLIDVLKPAIANPFEQAATIDEELEEFKKLLSGYNGSQHETRYLRLLWGSYLLECRLTQISIAYILFRKDGRPIRAKATCKFKGTQSYGEMQADQNQQSPDVTHEKVFKQEDKFTLMAEQIYKNKQHYTDAARANGLLSFRNIETGKKLLFPPLK